MFDRNEIAQQRGPSTIVVNEQRAPTDDSVRLLREMESAAEKRIMESVRLSSPQFDCVIHRMQDPASFGSTFHVLYSLNGTTRRLKVEANDLRETVSDAMVRIRAAIAEDFAAHVISKCMQQVLR